MRVPPAPAFPLTERQRKFAEKHHGLVCGYLRRHHLDIREYYDVVILGYLQAVQRYLTDQSLTGYRISTIAWRAMNRSLHSYRRSESRRLAAQQRYAERQSVGTDSLWAELDAALLLYDLARIATEEQYALVSLRLQGYSAQEAAKARGISVRQVYRQCRQLYHAYLNASRLKKTAEEERTVFQGERDTHYKRYLDVSAGSRDLCNDFLQWAASPHVQGGCNPHRDVENHSV